MNRFRLIDEVSIYLLDSNNTCNSETKMTSFLMLIIICEAHLLANLLTIPLMYNLVL